MHCLHATKINAFLRPNAQNLACYLMIFMVGVVAVLCVRQNILRYVRLALLMLVTDILSCSRYAS